MILQRAAGSAIETRHGRAGSWTGWDGTLHPAAVHNTWTSAAWFSPATIVQQWTTDPELVVSTIGPEEIDGVRVEHLHAYRRPAANMDAGTAAIVAGASRMDLYLDSGTYKPVRLELDAHPDNDMLRGVPVRVEFADYRDGQAYRIRKYLNGTLLLDVEITEVSGGKQ